MTRTKFILAEIALISFCLALSFLWEQLFDNHDLSVLVSLFTGIAMGDCMRVVWLVYRD